MNPTRPSHHDRRSLRLPVYDYTQPGAYFVTICTWQRQGVLGEINEGHMRLNEWGRVAAECWAAIPMHFARVVLDEWVIMPNHMHGILVITDSNDPSAVGARQCRAPTPPESGAPTTPQSCAPITPESGTPTTPESHALTTPDSATPSDVGARQCCAPTPPESGAPTIPESGAPTTPPAHTPTTGEQFGHPVPGSIPTIIRSFKSIVTRRINVMRGVTMPPVWQSDYYEQIVRNDRALAAIRRYILENPLQWALDRDNADGGLPEAATADDYWREAQADGA